MSFDTTDLANYEENVLEYHIYFDLFQPDPHNEENSNTLDTNTKKIPVNDVYNYAKGPIKQEVTISAYLLGLRASLFAYLSPLLRTYQWESQGLELSVWNPAEQLSIRQQKHHSTTIQGSDGQNGFVNATKSYADIILGLDGSSSSSSSNTNKKSQQTKQQTEFREMIENNYPMFATKPGEYTTPFSNSNNKDNGNNSNNNKSKQQKQFDPTHDPAPPKHIANIPHLYGKLHYGNNSDDLFYIHYLFLQLSQRFPDLSIHITENQQYLLLLDYINALPSWCSKVDVMENRLWLRNGMCMIIPRGHYRHKDTSIYQYYQSVVNNHIEHKFLTGPNHNNNNNTLDTSENVQNILHNTIGLQQHLSDNTNGNNKNKNTKNKKLDNDMYGKALDFLHHYFPTYLNPQMALYYIQHYTAYCYISHYHQRLLQHKIRLYPYMLTLSNIIIPVLIPLPVASILSNGMINAVVLSNTQSQFVNDKSSIYNISSTLFHHPQYNTHQNNFLQLCYDEYVNTHNATQQYTASHRFEHAFVNNVVKKFTKFLYNQSIYVAKQQLQQPQSDDIPSTLSSQQKQEQQEHHHHQPMPFILYPVMLTQHRITQLLQLPHTPDDYYLSHIPQNVQQLVISNDKLQQDQHIQAQKQQQQRNNKTNNKQGQQQQEFFEKMLSSTASTASHNKPLNKTDISTDAVSLGYKITLLLEYMYQRGVQRFKALDGQYIASHNQIKVRNEEEQDTSTQNTTGNTAKTTTKTATPFLYAKTRKYVDLFPEQIANNTLLILREVIRQRFYVIDHYHMLLHAQEKCKELNVTMSNTTNMFNSSSSSSATTTIQQQDNIKDDKMMLEHLNPVPYLATSTLEGRNGYQDHTSIIHIAQDLMDLSNNSAKSAMNKQVFNGNTGQTIQRDNNNSTGDGDDDSGDLSYLNDMLKTVKTTKYQSLQDNPYVSYHPEPLLNTYISPSSNNNNTSSFSTRNNSNYTINHQAFALDNTKLNNTSPIHTYLSKSLRDFDNSITLYDIFALLVLTDPNEKNIKTYTLNRLFTKTAQFEQKSSTTQKATTNNKSPIIDIKPETLQNHFPAIPTSKLHRCEEYLLDFINLTTSNDDYFLSSDYLLTSMQNPDTIQFNSISSSNPTNMNNTGGNGSTFTSFKTSQKPIFSPTQFYHFSDDGAGLFNGHYRESNLYLWDPLSFVTIADQFTILPHNNKIKISLNNNNNQKLSKSIMTDDIIDNTDNVDDINPFLLPTPFSIYDDIYKILIQRQKTNNNKDGPDTTTKTTEPTTTPTTNNNTSAQLAALKKKAKLGSLLSNPIYSDPTKNQQQQQRKSTQQQNSNNTTTNNNNNNLNQNEKQKEQQLPTFDPKKQTPNIGIITELPQSPYINIPTIVGLHWYYAYYSIFAPENAKSVFKSKTSKQTVSSSPSNTMNDDTSGDATIDFIQHDEQIKGLDLLLELDISNIIQPDELLLVYKATDNTITTEDSTLDNAAENKHNKTQKGLKNVKDLNIKKILQHNLQKTQQQHQVDNNISFYTSNGEILKLTTQQQYIFALLYLIDLINDNKVVQQINKNNNIQQQHNSTKKNNNTLYTTATLPSLLEHYNSYDNTIDLPNQINVTLDNSGQQPTFIKLSLTPLESLLLCIYHIYYDTCADDIMLYHKFVGRKQLKQEMLLINEHFNAKYQNAQKLQRQRDADRKALDQWAKEQGLTNDYNQEYKEIQLDSDDDGVIMGIEEENVEEEQDKLLTSETKTSQTKKQSLEDKIKSRLDAMKAELAIINSNIKSQHSIDNNLFPAHNIGSASKTTTTQQQSQSGAAFWQNINGDYSDLLEDQTKTRKSKDDDGTDHSGVIQQTALDLKSLVSTHLTKLDNDVINAATLANNNNNNDGEEEDITQREDSSYHQRQQYFLKKRQELQNAMVEEEQKLVNISNNKNQKQNTTFTKSGSSSDDDDDESDIDYDPIRKAENKALSATQLKDKQHDELTKLKKDWLDALIDERLNDDFYDDKQKGENTNTSLLSMLDFDETDKKQKKKNNKKIKLSNFSLYSSEDDQDDSDSDDDSIDVLSDDDGDSLDSMLSAYKSFESEQKKKQKQQMTKQPKNKKSKNKLPKLPGFADNDDISSSDDDIYNDYDEEDNDEGGIDQQTFNMLKMMKAVQKEVAQQDAAIKANPRSPIDFTAGSGCDEHDDDDVLPVRKRQKIDNNGKTNNKLPNNISNKNQTSNPRAALFGPTSDSTSATSKNKQTQKKVRFDVDVVDEMSRFKNEYSGPTFHPQLTDSDDDNNQRDMYDMSDDDDDDITRGSDSDDVDFVHKNKKRNFKNTKDSEGDSDDDDDSSDDDFAHLTKDEQKMRKMMLSISWADLLTKPIEQCTVDPKLLEQVQINDYHIAVMKRHQEALHEDELNIKPNQETNVVSIDQENQIEDTTTTKLLNDGDSDSNNMSDEENNNNISIQQYLQQTIDKFDETIAEKKKLKKELKKQQKQQPKLYDDEKLLKYKERHEAFLETHGEAGLAEDIKDAVRYLIHQHEHETQQQQQQEPTNPKQQEKKGEDVDVMGDNDNSTNEPINAVDDEIHIERDYDQDDIDHGEAYAMFIEEVQEHHYQQQQQNQKQQQQQHGIQIEIMEDDQDKVITNNNMSSNQAQPPTAITIPFSDINNPNIDLSQYNPVVEEEEEQQQQTLADILDLYWSSSPVQKEDESNTNHQQEKQLQQQIAAQQNEMLTTQQQRFQQTTPQDLNQHPAQRHYELYSNQQQQHQQNNNVTQQSQFGMFSFGGKQLLFDEPLQHQSDDTLDNNNYHGNTTTLSQGTATMSNIDEADIDFLMSYDNYDDDELDIQFQPMNTKQKSNNKQSNNNKNDIDDDNFSFGNNDQTRSKSKKMTDKQTKTERGLTSSPATAAIHSAAPSDLTFKKKKKKQQQSHEEEYLYD